MLTAVNCPGQCPWRSNGQHFVEYFGEHVESASHGNCKNPNAPPFIRTPATTMEQIADKLRHDGASDVYKDVRVKDDIADAPRNMRVVQNKKASQSRATRQETGTRACHNLADEVQSVINMAYTDNFVRQVVATSGKVPSVIVYTDRQIDELKGFCFDSVSGSVLGFDKTYNLGSMYVTPSVYKNVALNRTRTGDHPLFMGPIFVHSHSDTQTYNQFFGHLSGLLMGCDFQQLRLGSDDEHAMCKSMKHFFPRAHFLTCSRHLKENCSRKLDEVLGSSSPERRAVMDALFGTAGLISCTEVVSFDASATKLQTAELRNTPAVFYDYVLRRVFPLMRQNVLSGNSKWTNNNAESVNHVLKQAIDWRPQQLPDLIDILRKLVESQYTEADRAMCGVGDFVLHSAFVKHRHTVDSWRLLTAKQRSKAVAACFKIAQSTSTASDGTITVPTTPGGGKKPHQRKRKRAEKNTSKAKKVLLG